MSISSLFTGHPASVGESYLQHLRMALTFSVRMMLSGAACFVHALFPFLFVSTGSRCIQQLHESMVLRRRRRPPEPVIVDTARPLTG